MPRARWSAQRAASTHAARKRHFIEAEASRGPCDGDVRVAKGLGVTVTLH